MGKRRKSKKTSKNVLVSLLIIIIIVALVIGVRHKKISTNEENIVETNIAELENFVSTDELANDVDMEEILDIMDKDENLVAQDIKNSNLENKNTNLNTGTATYKLEVNVASNVVNVYAKDSDGNYTKCVKAMVCSTGGHTPHSGTYYLKSRWRWRALFNNVYGQYAVHITGNILFHSVPYTKNGDPGSLEYWEYDKLGTSASLGCVRLKVSDVLWIYNNCPKGTMVRFYDDSNPGPLGKPSAQKISSNETCRGWDPTDPDSKNPWKTYKEPKSTEVNTTSSTNTTKTNVKNEIDENKTKETNTTTETNTTSNVITENIIKEENLVS